jgi:hypothetical protein
LLAAATTVPVPASAQARTAPLGIAVVVDVTTGPLFSTEGTRSPDADRRLTSLADMLGSLRLPELDGIPVALAVSPVLCDEARLAGGASAGRLRSMLAELTPRLPLLSAPYAPLRLTDLRSGSAVRHEISAGRTALAACTGRSPGGLLFPPGLVMSDDALAAAPSAGINASLVTTDVLRAPARTSGVTLVPAAEVATGDAPNDALVRFADDAAVVAIVEPRRDLATFITALANDPRVIMRSLDDLTADAPQRSPELAPGDRLPRTFVRAVTAARRSLDRLRAFTLPGNTLAAILATGVAHARATHEWDGRWSTGTRIARRISEACTRQEHLVSAATGAVTFTSQRGSLPVTVVNRATYPVRVRVALASSKLSFPSGPSRVVTVDPPGDTIVYAALARSTGAFPVQVHISSPDGTVRFASALISVRSTAANLAALVLTAGGAVFLIGWQVRLLRRRRRGERR